MRDDTAGGRRRGGGDHRNSLTTDGTIQCLDSSIATVRIDGGGTPGRVEEGLGVPADSVVYHQFPACRRGRVEGVWFLGSTGFGNGSRGTEARRLADSHTSRPGEGRVSLQR